eukprot:s420_g21.t1
MSSFFKGRIVGHSLGLLHSLDVLFLLPATGFNAPPVVRWVPKKRGFRPIVKIAKWADQGKLGAKQKAVLPILANLRASNPGILGHSLMNQNEVHGHLLEAMARLKAHYGPNIQDGLVGGWLGPSRLTWHPPEDLYVVVADLRNCYDRILHQPLLGRIDQLPLQKRYKIVPMSLQRGTGRPQYLDLALHRAGGNAVAELLRSLTTCPAPLRREPLVLMPGRSVQTEVTCSEVTKILKSAVQGCAVLLASQPRTVELPNYAAPIPVGCRLLSGIPQGSRFSPFLCALHMGAGDGRLPADVAESLGSGRSALARLVDDFLYLSTDPRSCCNFLSCLAQEENPYQGDLNWQKCAGNFPFRSLESSQDPCFVPASSQRLPPSSTEVPWAGLTLAPANGFLNIRQGTKRRVTDAMAVRKPKRGKLGKVKVIRSKLLNFLKLKLQPLLLDPRLNSPDCVRDNLLRVCRGCAWRFLWLLHSRRLPTVTPVFVRRQTQRLVRYATRRADTVREGLASNDQLNIKGIVRSAFRGALRPRQNRPLLKEASESLKPRLKGARRMEHVVSYVVDLSLRTYRACMPNSMAAKSLSELLFALGYTIKKGDLAGIPGKEWRAFHPEEQAFEANTSYLKALMAAAFSDQLLLGGYGSIAKEIDTSGKSNRKQLEQLEALQKLMEKHDFPARETVLFGKDVKDPHEYVEHVSGNGGRSVEKEETHTLVRLSLNAQSEGARWCALASRKSAPLLVSKTRLPAEFNLLSQFQKHMQELQRVQATGWTYKPVPFIHPHILRWEWMEPLYTPKGALLRCEGMLERKNPVGLVGYVQPLEEGKLKPVACFAVAANVRGGHGPTNCYPESVTCLSPGHIAFVLSTTKLDLTRTQLRRFGFTTRGELAVLHRCVDLPSGCLYGAAWERVRLLRQAGRGQPVARTEQRN